jgi:4,5-DOPA dioxygenase extradiol
MKSDIFNELSQMPGSSEMMPVLFVGHGSPMNAIEENEFSKGWREMGQCLPKPKAILCISAHWETRGTQVTAMQSPRTIHDFGGFPRALFEAQYPAPGSPWLAEETKEAIKRTLVVMDEGWGLDHGCWSILRQMFPQADVPVVQLSLDYGLAAQDHYALAKELAPLRQKGVLILGSGNLVHNLRRVVLRGNNLSDFNQPFGLDWALEANDLFKQLIDANDHQRLADYHSLGRAVELAVPTPEHFLPVLYALALKGENEPITYFNDKPLAGSLTMTSLLIGQAG